MEIKTLGKVKLLCKPVNRPECELEFLVVEKDEAVPILGADAAVNITLIKRVYSLKSTKKFVVEYEKVFEGLGRFPHKYEIKLREDVKPTVKPTRRYPQVIVEKLKPALRKL